MVKCEIALLLILFTFCQPYLAAKVWTIDDRQQKLMQEINAGQKSGELTLKEAHILRKQEAHIARKKAKMKAKNLGRLSSDDITDLEKELNKVSIDLNKYRLEKRVSNSEKE